MKTRGARGSSQAQVTPKNKISNDHDSKKKKLEKSLVLATSMILNIQRKRITEDNNDCCFFFNVLRDHT